MDQFCPKSIQIQKIRHAKTNPADMIGVGRTDSLAGSADFGIARFELPQLIQDKVLR